MPTPSEFLDSLRKELVLFETIKKRRPKRTRLHILVVEDQLFSRKLLHQVLKDKYDVTLAATAYEGTRLYLEAAPDIAFLDIELEGESGHILAKLIKEIDNESYVVMVTGNKEAHDVAEAKKNQVAGYIVKPYSKQKIFEAITGYFVLHPEKNPEGKKA